jgi:hypothetical protein
VTVTDQAQHQLIAAASQPDPALDASPLAVINLAADHATLNTPSHAASDSIRRALYTTEFLNVFQFESPLLPPQTRCATLRPATILFSVVALLFSIAFEGYQLHWLALLSIACVLVGNGSVLRRGRT